MMPVLKKRSQLFLAGVWAGLARLGAATATAAVLGLNSRCLLPAVWPRRAEARGRVRACCAADMLAMADNARKRPILTCWWLRACCCRENCGLRGSCAATLFLAAALRP